jgi:Ala-tRNA(Pro) deacylase
MGESVFERVENFLRQQGIDFQVLRHEPVFTSEQAAAVRGVPLASGAKALVCKVDERFALFVIPADRKLDGKRVRQALGSRSLRFATVDELRQLTGLAPGSVPPFGRLFGLTTCCDSRMADSEKINFNAGDHSISISMRWVDYLRVENPTLGGFTA